MKNKTRCLLLATTWVLACAFLSASSAQGKTTPDLAATQNSPAAQPQALQVVSGVAGCHLLPADNIWNVRVDNLPVDPRSDAYIASIGSGVGLHPDFGSGTWDGGPIGIPYNVVDAGQAGVQVSFRWADESDTGPYPIPTNPLIEGGPNSSGDRHILIIDQDNCKLYELYHAFPQTGGWRADSGAIFDLNSNALRPVDWTSADAAGLPILAGLARYDEVASGVIAHALRFTVENTRNQYVWPARHQASYDSDLDLPPMGERFRLKSSYDISGYTADVRVILQALKTYGMILADNGSNWYISGAPDERWDNDSLHALHQVPGSAFEAVDVSGLMVDPNSGLAVQAPKPPPVLWLPLMLH